MDSYMTVKEAATALGVTMGRIRQLVDGGRLRSEKLSDRFRVIVRADVEQLASTERKPGRPRKQLDPAATQLP